MSDHDRNYANKGRGKHKGKKRARSRDGDASAPLRPRPAPISRGRFEQYRGDRRIHSSSVNISERNVESRAEVVRNNMSTNASPNSVASTVGSSSSHKDIPGYYFD